MTTQLKEPGLQGGKAVPATTGLSIDEVFSDLGPEALQVFQELQVKSFHPPGTPLFAEGQTPAGIFFLCTGMVRIFMADPAGQRVISRTAHPGELLGVT
jgi:CRP-like cAMP-binding protein